MQNEFDVVVIGAGAAGLSAAKALQASGRSFMVLEASHKIGGRAYTEELRPGEFFDLGAHWIHSASNNPFTPIAKELGITAKHDNHDEEQDEDAFYEKGRKLSEEELEDFDAFTARQYKTMETALTTHADISVYDATERNHKWTPYFDYYFVQEYTIDVDQVSVKDVFSFSGIKEDLALKEGFGTLLTRFGEGLPITLNAAIKSIDWSGTKVRLNTTKGDFSAKAVIITVSTGILAANDILFKPALPDWKQEAIHGLPLGNSNRICLGFDENIFNVKDHTYITVTESDDEPMEMVIRPFGFSYVEFVTGGRFADWLEKAGDAAAVDFATKKVQAVFGQDIAKHVDKYITTAWRGDGWTKGTYSGALPGQAHQRAELAKPINNQLYFAGEACSTDKYATVHGAYFTGKAAVKQLLEDHQD